MTSEEFKYIHKEYFYGSIHDYCMFLVYWKEQPGLQIISICVLQKKHFIYSFIFIFDKYPFITV